MFQKPMNLKFAVIWKRFVWDQEIKTYISRNRTAVISTVNSSDAMIVVRTNLQVQWWNPPLLTSVLHPNVSKLQANLNLTNNKYEYVVGYQFWESASSSYSNYNSGNVSNIE